MKNAGGLSRLIEQARRDKPPRVDVTGPVMRRIAAMQVQASPEAHPMTWLAALSGLAAAAVLAAAWHSWQSSLDPVAEILYLAGGIL